MILLIISVFSSHVPQANLHTSSMGESIISDNTHVYFFISDKLSIEKNRTWVVLNFQNCIELPLSKYCTFVQVYVENRSMFYPSVSEWENLWVTSRASRVQDFWARTRLIKIFGPVTGGLYSSVKHKSTVTHIFYI